MLRSVLPELTTVNRAFWTGGQDGLLLITRCAACGHYAHPPQAICPECLSRDVTPVSVSGSGTVYSFTINHQPWVPGLDVPYALAVVELPEQAGLRITSNICGAKLENIRIDMPVTVDFDQAEDVWVPIFRPTESADRQDTDS